MGSSGRYPTATDPKAHLLVLTPRLQPCPPSKPGKYFIIDAPFDASLPLYDDFIFQTKNQMMQGLTTCTEYLTLVLP